MQIKIKEPHNQSLLQHMQGTGYTVCKYLNSYKLDQVLRTTWFKSLSDIECIAKGLAISDPKNIIMKDLILCSQIKEALRFETEASKINIINQNPASVKYTVGMSKEEIKKEKTKIKRVEKLYGKEENYNIFTKKKCQTSNSGAIIRKKHKKNHENVLSNVIQSPQSYNRKENKETTSIEL
ncbi:6964_t:CDS:2, partial [Cetraspora pellucida]